MGHHQIEIGFLPANDMALAIHAVVRARSATSFTSVVSSWNPPRAMYLDAKVDKDMQFDDRSHARFLSRTS